MYLITFVFRFSYSEEQIKAIEKLLTLIDVINETVGDAISDMLLVETILHAKGWNISDWESCYTDLPNRLLKVTVKVTEIEPNDSRTKPTILGPTCYHDNGRGADLCDTERPAGRNQQLGFQVQ